mgnify:CR=1 FL=1
MLRFEQRLDIRALQYITPLRRCAAGSSNQAAHLTVTPPVGGQHDEGQTAIEMKLRADDEARAASLQRGVGTYHPCHGTLVRQRERSVAQGLGAFSEFHGLRGTAQETEAAEAMQLGVIGHHASRKCRAGTRRAVVGARGTPTARHPADHAR